MKRALLLVAFAACAPPEEAAAPAAVVVAPVSSGATAAAAPARRNLFAATTACDSSANQLCPVAPSFPSVRQLYFDGAGRPCIDGLDRHGCLEPDGWRFAMGPAGAPGSQAGRFDYAPEACRLAEAGWVMTLQSSGRTLFWGPKGQRVLVSQGETGCRTLPPIPLEPIQANVATDGIVAASENDVWAWSSRFVSHWDGARWERVELPPPCTRESPPAAVVAGDGTIWFARCEDKTRVLVRFDPRLNQATSTTVAPMLGLALVAGKVTATDFDDARKTFRRHVFEPDGRDSTTDDDRVFLRAGFPDGTVFAATFGLFSEIQRAGPDKVVSTIALPSPAEGFYAPSPREVWAGGASLQRWRDGMMGKLVYRPDAAKEAVTAIGGSSANDVWVASRPAHAGSRNVHLSHWDGSAWRQADLPGDAHGMRAFAVASPTDAWLTTDDHLWHWNGVSWTKAGAFPEGHGAAVVLTPEAVFVLGNSTIYRRAR